MAQIAYKSQGAGAATETSGAACSPASPAVVDAGDILIIHAYFEGTVTTPNTPTGFTLLDGPRVIESTIGRHWIFGKIAAGTEDGAANALGTQAVTTMRSGRCYSFSGRVAGAITDLVKGFGATSHATDPQMPAVTTTHSQSLAVACIAQNDNNTAASATGETGGDWVEAVAEFTAALTPGLMLQIQTATITTPPGTISGGSVATANDPCGVIGFEIAPDLVAVDLVIAEATQAQTVDTLTLVPDLVIAEALQVQIADNVVLEAGTNLIVAEALQAQISDNLDLVQQNNLVIAEATQAQVSDNLDLVQQNNLVITEALQAQTADNVVLDIPVELLIQDALHGGTVGGGERVHTRGMVDFNWGPR